jgi:processed acidic surface protein
MEETMMKKFLFIITACLFLNTTVFEPRVLAAINQQELEQYLESISWTMEDLNDYLADFDLTLADFETLDELKNMLGTPITPDNLNELLARYNLTQEELEALLGQFGETPQDYTFIEDLDMAVDFYLNHEKEMQEIIDMLATIGFTEEEANRLFEHIMSLDEAALEQRMEGLDARFERFVNIEDPSELTEEQKEDLLAIWEELLAALEISPKFYLANGNTKQAIAYRDLVKLDTLGGRDLLVELYNMQGELLVDMQLSEEMLLSDFIFQAGEDFLHVGEMASEMKVTMQGEKMPNTASPYLMNILIGLCIALLGWLIYRKTREKAVE